jgi:4-aminobutyrate aminotransferase
VWPSGAHANTFGGNPVACAAGLKTLEIIERDGLVEHARTMGEYLSKKLQGLFAKHYFLYEERGLGLLRALEVVKDRATRTPDPARRDRIVNECFKRGLLLLGCGETAIRFLPALTVEKGHIDAATESLAAAIRAT